MTRVLHYLVSIVILSASTLYAESPTQKKVGIILPLSGGAAPIGVSIKDGILLAQSEHDPKGNTHFVFEDDQFQPPRTIQAFRRLVDIERVSGLLVMGMGQGFAVNHLAEQSRVPLLIIGIDPLLAEKRSYVMRFFPSIDAIHQAMIGEVRRLGYKSVALVASTVDATLALKSRFEAEAPGLVSFSESFLPDARDFSTVVSKINALHVDAVGILMMPPQVSIFAKQLRERGFTGKIFGPHMMENQAEFAAAKGALDDSWFVSAAVTSDPRFFERYSNMYPDSPEHYASMSYDIGTIFIRGNASAIGLNDFMHTLKDFKGAIGTYSATARNDFDLPVKVRTGREALANWKRGAEATK